MNEQTDEKRTGLQKIVDKAADFCVPPEDAERMRMPVLDRYEEQLNDYDEQEERKYERIGLQQDIFPKHMQGYELSMRLFKHYTELDIREYLLNRTLAEKLQGLVPYSKERGKQLAAKDTLSEIENKLSQSVLENLPDGTAKGVV